MHFNIIQNGIVTAHFSVLQSCSKELLYSTHKKSWQLPAFVNHIVLFINYELVFKIRHEHG